VNLNVVPTPGAHQVAIENGKTGDVLASTWPSARASPTGGR
jgi:hypothetical protein